MEHGAAPVSVFFDTSVLVAASVGQHPHYPQAYATVTRTLEARRKAYISIHSLAEIYAALTRLPVQPAIHPVEAVRIVVDNIVPHFEPVVLDLVDYRAALAAVASGGWRGARIYDALLLRCAEKKDCQRIYTFNLVEFRLLAPHLAKRILSP